MIISGVWYTGADAASAKDFGPGSVVMMPANWVHVSGCRAGSDCVFEAAPRAGEGRWSAAAAPVSDAQTGRFIFGPECYFPGCPNPATSRHRDTIVNLLASFTLGNAEVKAGPGLARSVTHQGDGEFNHYDRTNLVLTTGLDVVLPIGRRLSLVPTAGVRFRGALR